MNITGRMCGQMQTINHMLALTFCVVITLETFRLFASTRLPPSTSPLSVTFTQSQTKLFQAYDKWIHEQLGEKIRAAKQTAGIEALSLTLHLTNNYNHNPISYTVMIRP